MAAQSAKAGSSGAKTHKTNRSRREPQPPPRPAAEQAKAAKARSHPTRLQILAAAKRGPISPAEFAKAHGMSTGTAAHHFKVLVKYEALRLLKEERVHGSVRHLYVATQRAVYMESELPMLPESLQASLVMAALEDFIGVTAEAVEAGTLTGRDDFVGTWDEAKLDEIAWKKLGLMLRLVWKKVPSLEEETAVREEAGGAKSFTAVVGLAAFEVPKAKRAKSVRKRKSDTSS